MKRKGETIALALTWDGSRWPMRTLPVSARAFLKADGAIPSAKKMARLLAEDRVKEFRICWVARLQGGEKVLCESFSTATGLRIGFRVGRMRRFGDVLGVVYRRITR